MLALLGSVLCAAAPLLTQPAQARRDLASAPGLAAAEALLLAGDPQAALPALARRSPPVSGTGPRFLRLQADIRLALGDRLAASSALDALEQHAGWGAHVAARRRALDATSASRSASRYGLGLFACALAVLVLAGARELLRIRVESLVMAAAVLAALALTRYAAPAWAPLVGLVYVALLSVAHATAAARRRSEPGPRGRLLLAVVAVLAAGGVLAAAVGSAPIGRLIDGLWA